METERLLYLLKRVSDSDPKAIIKLVRDNKDTFDRDGLKPNGIDCIDRAIDHAYARHATYEEDSFKGVKSYTFFGSYTLFHICLEAARRKTIHDAGIEPHLLVDSQGNPKRPSTIKLWRPTYETHSAVRNIEEIMDLKEIFDIYVGAKLKEKGMSDYLAKLDIPSSK
ncbi:hypothetical protein HYX08_04950 [Candidatus Woesearchaeota archaeon]|nr:hypothetical protein [Candidatus Woesearchaeota archaeon]